MIYERIKSLTKGKISINQLEKELGISSGSLCKIDKNKPSSDKLQKIADYLGVSVDYLMTGKENASSFMFSEENADFLVEIQIRAKNPDFVNRMRKYLDLIDSDRKSVDDMIDYLDSKNKKEAD